MADCCLLCLFCLGCLSACVRYDEFGRRKRSKNEEDKRAREQAALQRLYGGTNLAPSELVSNNLHMALCPAEYAVVPA